MEAIPVVTVEVGSEVTLAVPPPTVVEERTVCTPGQSWRGLEEPRLDQR